MEVVQLLGPQGFWRHQVLEAGVGGSGGGEVGWGVGGWWLEHGLPLPQEIWPHQSLFSSLL